ncbi:MAG: response regulator [Rhodocyclaceae bacterium]|nr:response regulator [Rhodocyclaceae bacterium]
MSPPLKLLVIEDVEADFLLIERHLRQQGLACLCRRVATAEEVIAALDEPGWDLVLSDYNLPGQSFRALLALFQARAPELPVILVSGSIGEETAVEMLKAGAWDFVLKDRLGRLVPAIEHALREVAARAERRNMERALRDSQADLNQAQTVGQFGSWRLDVRHNRLSWSREIYRMFGLPEGTPLSYEDFLAIVHPDDRAFVELRWRAALEGEPYDIEHRIVVWGQVRWIRERAELELAPDGTPSSALGTAQDITDRKQAEQELRLRGTALEAAANSIIITDTGGLILWVNSAFCALSGYSREEAIGRRPGALLKSGEHGAAFYRDMWHTITSGRVWHGELVNRRKNGEHYHEEMTITPVQDERGLVQHYIAIKQDITARHDAQVALADYHERLENARGEALELAQVKSDFLANMSHEIRTPLNAVLGLAQAGLREDMGRKSGATFARILEAGQLLLGVINDILDFSKIEAGKLSVEQVPVDLPLVVDQAADMMAERARDKGLQFSVEKAPDLPAGFLGDALRVSQVLINLLSNAIKFTEKGEIRLTAAREGAQLRFTILDTGIGIGQEHIERLFDAFEQQDTTTTRRYGGTGLGLAISLRLAHLMGGDITVDSTPGQGSRFTLSLPLAEAVPPTRTQTAEATADPRLAGLRILAAEDNSTNRLVLEELLAPEGVSLVQVENGRLAVETIAREGESAFDVVLMDIQMPEMDGYAATQALRQMAPRLPIIGLTAHALAEERDKILAAGMVAHVAKPVQMDLLVAAILQALRPDALPSAPSMPRPDSASGQSHVSGVFDVAPLMERYNGKTAFIERLLRSVLADHGPTPARLRSYADRADWEQGGFLAHNAKSVAGHLADLKVQNLAAEAERAAREGRPDAGARLTDLADAFQGLLALVEAHLGRV